MFLLSFTAFFLQFCLDGPSYNFGLLSEIGNLIPQTFIIFFCACLFLTAWDNLLIIKCATVVILHIQETH